MISVEVVTLEAPVRRPSTTTVPESPGAEKALEVLLDVGHDAAGAADSPAGGLDYNKTWIAVLVERGRVAYLTV